MFESSLTDRVIKYMIQVSATVLFVQSTICLASSVTYADSLSGWHCLCYQERVDGAIKEVTACRTNAKACNKLMKKTYVGSKAIVAKSLSRDCRTFAYPPPIKNDDLDNYKKHLANYNKNNRPWRFMGAQKDWIPSKKAGSWWSKKGCLIPANKRGKQNKTSLTRGFDGVLKPLTKKPKEWNNKDRWTHQSHVLSTGQKVTLSQSSERQFEKFMKCPSSKECPHTIEMPIFSWTHKGKTRRWQFIQPILYDQERYSVIDYYNSFTAEVKVHKGAKTEVVLFSSTRAEGEDVYNSTQTIYLIQAHPKVGQPFLIWKGEGAQLAMNYSLNCGYEHRLSLSIKENPKKILLQFTPVDHDAACNMENRRDIPLEMQPTIEIY